MTPRRPSRNMADGALTRQRENPARHQPKLIHRYNNKTVGMMDKMAIIGTLTLFLWPTTHYAQPFK